MAEEIVVTEKETTPTPTKSALAFNVESREGKIKLFNALNNAQSLSESNIQTLTLEGVIVQATHRTDMMTGEIVPAKSTTFITSDGDYFTQSEGIARSAENLIAAFGNEFGECPITIQFGTKNLQGGRTMKFFSIVA